MSTSGLGRRDQPADTPVRWHGADRTAVPYAVVSAMLKAETLEEATPAILRVLCETLGCDLVQLWTVSPSGDVLQCLGVWHPPSEMTAAFVARTAGQAFTRGVGLPGRVWASGEPTWITDVGADHNFPRFAAASKAGLHAAFAVPIVLDDQVHGVIELFSHEVLEPDCALLDLMAVVSREIGQCLVYEQMRQELAAVNVELRAQLDEMARLHELTLHLSGEFDLPPVLKRILRAVVRLQDASMGTVMLRDVEARECYTVASIGFSDEYLEVVGRLPDGVAACGTAVAEQRAVIVEDVEADPLFEPYIPVARLAGYRSVYSTPLVTIAGEALGTIATYFPQPHRPQDREIRLVELYVRQAAELIENARRYQQARAHSRQLHALAESALWINSTLSLDAMLERITNQARETIGAHQSITSLTMHPDWARATTVSLSKKYAAWRDYDEVPDGSGIYAVVCRENRPLRVPRAELEAHPAWRGFSHAADRHPPVRGWLAAPLVGRDGENLGLIQVFDKYEGHFTKDDEAILVHLAQMATVAIENAQLSARQHRITETFQRSMLPEQLPVVPGVDVAARYLPGGAGVEVGGDWYDVVALRDGRVVFALGDVAERGVRAAAIMGQLRTGLRAYALEGHPPAVIFERLDGLLQQLGKEQMATLLALVLEPDTGRLEIVSAGHLLPLLLGPDHAVRYLDVEVGVPLGVADHPTYHATVLHLEPGTTLLLYTDGLVELRAAPISDGLGRLQRAASDHAPAAEGDLDKLCDGVLSALLPEETADDDVALLALRLVPFAGDRLRLRLEAEAEALVALRRALQRWFDLIGAPPSAVHDLLVASGEACANAIEHAYGLRGGVIEVEGAVDGDAITLLVRDFGQWRDARGVDRGRGLSLIRALTDEVEVTRSPAGTEVRMVRRSAADRSGEAGALAPAEGGDRLGEAGALAPAEGGDRTGEAGV